MIEHIHDLLFVYGNKLAVPEVIPAIAPEDSDRPVRKIAGKILREEPAGRMRKFFTPQGDILYFTARQRLPDRRRSEAAALLTAAEDGNEKIARVIGSGILVPNPDEHQIASLSVRFGVASPFTQQVNDHPVLPSRIHLAQSIREGTFYSHNTGPAPVSDELLQSIVRLLERPDMRVVKHPVR